jgi:hypothetical protein
VAVDYETHRFICWYGGWLIVIGLVLLVLGEGAGPLVASVATTMVLARFANRMNRRFTPRTCCCRPDFLSRRVREVSSTTPLECFTPPCKFPAGTANLLHPREGDEPAIALMS